MATVHDSGSMPPVDIGDTFVHRITRSASGSPLATPWRNTGLGGDDAGLPQRMRGIEPIATLLVARNERLEIRRMTPQFIAAR